MNRQRTIRFRTSMRYDIPARNPSPEYHSETPQESFNQSLTILDADTANVSPPLPASLAPGPPVSCLPGEGLVSSPPTPRADSASSNHSHIASPQLTDAAILRSLPQSPESSPVKSSTPDLKMMYSPSHMIMQSPVPSVPGTPSWTRHIPNGDSRIRHNNYYLEDGVVFLAENTLFKVPRYMLNQESEVFHRLYSDQFEKGGKGSTDNDPITLNGVEAADFQQLLTVLYPRSIPVGASVPEFWTEVEWESVLHLAAMWEMPQVRLLVVGKMSSCASSMTKILLGKRYDISSWIRAGFLDLCLRDGPLTETEGSRLDWKDILKISRAREMIRFKVISMNRLQERESTKYGECYVYKTSYDPARYTQNMMVHHILDEIFGLEDLASDIDYTLYAPASPVPSSPAPSNYMRF